MITKCSICGRVLFAASKAGRCIDCEKAWNGAKAVGVEIREVLAKRLAGDRSDELRVALTNLTLKYANALKVLYGAQRTAWEEGFPRALWQNPAMSEAILKVFVRAAKSLREGG